MTGYERKEMISKFQKTTCDVKLIDFLRKYYKHEYSDFFVKEREEKTANNRYTITLLEKDISTKYSIDLYYITFEVLRLIIFYEHICMFLDNGNTENEEKNRKIKEIKDIYNFYKALISNKKFNLSKYSNAIKILNFPSLTQEDIDDENSSTKETLKDLIFENALTNFIGEYNNYL